MKKIIFCLILSFLYFAGCALNRNDFPKNLQQSLDQRAEELKSKKGICIAGRVKMSDGAHISSGANVQVNFLQGADIPLWVYDGGWFVMDRTFKTDSYPQPPKLILRAFGYDPIDAAIAVSQGEITYLEFEMHKTNDKDLATVAGKVFNDQNEPLEGANVGISFPFASHGYSGGYNLPYKTMTTGKDGRYFFDGLSSTNHSLVASKSGHAYHSVHFTPAKGETTTKDLKLYPNRSIIIDYVYQADGSRSFTRGEIKSGTIEWVNGHDGVDFSDGRVKEYDYKAPRDIEMRQDQGALKFQIFYVSSESKNGFYDAGEVDFESVTEAGESGYSTGAKPCVAGHTYIVKTYEGNYAKFVVRSISGSK